MTIRTSFDRIYRAMTARIIHWPLLSVITLDSSLVTMEVPLTAHSP